MRVLAIILTVLTLLGCEETGPPRLQAKIFSQNYVQYSGTSTFVAVFCDRYGEMAVAFEAKNQRGHDFARIGVVIPDVVQGEVPYESAKGYAVLNKTVSEHVGRALLNGNTVGISIAANAADKSEALFLEPIDPELPNPFVPCGIMRTSPPD